MSYLSDACLVHYCYSSVGVTDSDFTFDFKLTTGQRMQCFATRLDLRHVRFEVADGEAIVLSFY